MAAPRPPLYAEPDLVVQHDLAPAEPEPPPEIEVSAEVEVVTPELEVEVVRPEVEVVTPELEVVSPEVEVVTHELEIVEAGAFARAVCRGCGWRGPARRARAVATADAERHP